MEDDLVSEDDCSNADINDAVLHRTDDGGADAAAASVCCVAPCGRLYFHASYVSCCDAR